MKFSIRIMTLALMIVLSMPLACCVEMTFSAGDGISSAGTSTNLKLSDSDSLSDRLVAGFGPGIQVSRDIRGTTLNGNGLLDEEHAVSNSQGDMASVHASLSGSDRWSYSYALSSSSRRVTASERVEVVNGTGLDFGGEASSSRGDLASVFARGGADCPVSMNYYNLVEATRNTAAAHQRVSGASVAGSDEGCTEPLVVGGSAGLGYIIFENFSILQHFDQFAGVEARALGVNSLNSAIDAESGAFGARASHYVSARNFESINSSGLAGKGNRTLNAALTTPLTDTSARVEAGAENGTRFLSQVSAKYERGVASAGQNARADGSRVFKSSFAAYKFVPENESYTDMARSLTVVLNGSLSTSDSAQARKNFARVSESLTASGMVHREIESEHLWFGNPGWKNAYLDVDIMGRLTGSATATATTDSAVARGRWRGFPADLTYGRSAIAQNATNGTGIFQLRIGDMPFVELADATGTRLAVV